MAPAGIRTVVEVPDESVHDVAVKVTFNEDAAVRTALPVQVSLPAMVIAELTGKLERFPPANVGVNVTGVFVEVTAVPIVPYAFATLTLAVAPLL